MTEIIDGLIVLLVMAGALLTLISAIGALRLPDVYMRSHAIGKSTTLGMIFILTGTLFYFWLKHHHFNSRLLLAIVFIFLTSPVSAHLISRAAYYSGVRPWEGTVRDDLAKQREKLAKRAK
ncbi:Na+/H+ antiporter subunit G [Geobacillus thermodenitrificans]|nr:monovalent cation/H(+) antiporter subunit G [Geobacillus thermodenitrificans]NNU86615.1 Na+/H+ antiporter subunit G [Geobacillus sp. MR]OQP09482.1 Na+/H+ antiporter subunit G [Geobacillus sp. 47C-IIb]ARP43946.1 Na(+)/H(+)antiporter subunit G [Geobacillus thermodenitrificans]MEC5187726.1 multicomponent Na+:H+ antiporter subunit G [Geobacillus thermodenitrificans]MED0662972.1 Na+/H+ antiporter subunit G [Geobacillus thermodenitrificans]